MYDVNFSLYDLIMLIFLEKLIPINCEYVFIECGDGLEDDVLVCVAFL
jgi:hypothetical protein